MLKLSKYGLRDFTYSNFFVGYLGMLSIHALLVFELKSLLFLTFKADRNFIWVGSYRIFSCQNLGIFWADSLHFAVLCRIMAWCVRLFKSSKISEVAEVSLVAGRGKLDRESVV